MKKNYCFICPDATHFNIAVSDACRIAYRLKSLCNIHSDIIHTLNINSREVMELNSYFQMPHMMCGQCYKVNKTEIFNYYREISKYIVIIKTIIISGKLDKQEQVSLKRETNEFVRGYFPRISQYVCKIQITKTE